MHISDEYDFDEYYGTTLAEDRKALAEDLEHLYFSGIGILTCALSGWKAAVFAGIFTVVLRDFIRGCRRKKH